MLFVSTNNRLSNPAFDELTELDDFSCDLNQRVCRLQGTKIFSFTSLLFLILRILFLFLLSRIERLSD